MIKQPKFWTNKNFISNILLPVSIIFLLLSKIRNLLQKKLKSKLFVQENAAAQTPSKAIINKNRKPLGNINANQ